MNTFSRFIVREIAENELAQLQSFFREKNTQFNKHGPSTCTSSSIQLKHLDLPTDFAALVPSAPAVQSSNRIITFTKRYPLEALFLAAASGALTWKML